MGTPYRVGLYGKLPSHGDFLRRRVADDFVTTWDAWLQASVAASRDALADRWTKVYLTSPAWRFAFGAGACGVAPVMGVMVPSVDRVGRHFPLTIVAELDFRPAGLMVTSVVEGAGFFEEAERILVEMLATEHVDFEAFDERVATLSEELASIRRSPGLVLDGEAEALLDQDGSIGWHVPVGTLANLSVLFQQLLSQRLTSAYKPLGLWWTDGSTLVPPSCLVTSGLPRPEGFSALLDGIWTGGGWRSIRERVG
ncbi:MAG: type VI secretion system-associated protein TagF [Acidobacteriota bacterium]|nr:type VI secretion system-associated protein TagF [Acidobacteriota bacterium]